MVDTSRHSGLRSGVKHRGGALGIVYSRMSVAGGVGAARAVM